MSADVPDLVGTVGDPSTTLGRRQKLLVISRAFLGILDMQSLMGKCQPDGPIVHLADMVETHCEPMPDPIATLLDH